MISLGAQAVATGDAHAALVNELEHELSGDGVPPGAERRRDIEELQLQVIGDLGGGERPRVGEEPVDGLVDGAAQRDAVDEIERHGEADLAQMLLALERELSLGDTEPR